MPVRIDQIFSVSTGTSPLANVQRVGGWKEQLWFGGTSSSAALTAYQQVVGGVGVSLQTARLALSPNAVKLVGLRIQPYTFSGLDLIPTGGMLPKPVGLPGTALELLDGAGSALEMRMGFTDVARQTTLRLEGLARPQIVGGEAKFDAAYAAAVNQWLLCLNGRFGSVLLNPGGVTYQKIKSITAEGLVTGRVRLVGLPRLSTVVVRSSLDTCRRRRGKRTWVFSVDVGVGTIVIADWPWGATTGGTIYSVARDFVTYSASRSRFEKLVQRKIGGPFDRFRGRSVRRPRS